MKAPALIAAFLLPLCAWAAESAAPVRLVPALGWDTKKQGGFPVSLAADQENNLWVGTEGNGLWKYDPGAKSWTQYTTKDGLGDDCVYALAVDGQDRVWAGHLNHGVSVFAGGKWRNYGLVDGPLGDRVFGITVSPADGDVWMATDMGLARYSQKRNDWDYYTRASGLPSDQIQGVAFDPAGNLYAATQCDGLATAAAADDYAKWQSITAASPMPREPAGQQMLTNLTNGISTVSVEAAGTPGFFVIAVPTPFGAEGVATQSTVINRPPMIVHGSFGNQVLLPSPGRLDLSMQGYVRSGDWSSALGLPPGLPGNLRLAEDWITGIQDSEKELWISYRKSGVQWIDTKFTSFRAATDDPRSVLIRAMLIQPDGPRYFAVYGGTGGGLMTLPDSPALAAKTGSGPASSKLPGPAAPPQASDANVFAARLDKISRTMAPGEAAYLADDWRTQGDWVGRYGNGYTVLCGMGKDADQTYALQPGYEISLRLGPNRKAGHDTPARSQGKATDDLRCLYDPTLGQRRDAFIDDGSTDVATYPDDPGLDQRGERLAWGPDLWATVKVPEGVHCLSLYFANYDAHDGGSRIYRDYDLQLVPWFNDDKEIQHAPPLARSRVTDFWGGVYKQFVICGPASYVVRIGRNGSFGTRLQGLFLDRMTGLLAENAGFLPGFDKEPYDPPNEPQNYQPGPLTEAAVTLWSQLDDALPLRGAIPLQMPFRLWCYRAALAGQAPIDLLVRWRWQISIWTPEERRQFDAAMKNAHAAAP